MNALILLFAGFPFAALPVFILVGGWLLYLLATKLSGARPTPAPEMIKAGACLERQAIKRHGVMKNGDFGQPELMFSCNDIEISVSVLEGNRSSPRLTFATFQTDFFPDRNFRIASGKFKAVISSSKIKNFSGAANREYDFEGDDGNLINRLMTEEIQNNLLEYQPAAEVRFGAHVGVKYALKPAAGRFYLSTDGFQIEDEDYDRLIETTVKFYERLKVMAAEEKANKKDSYEKLLSI